MKIVTLIDRDADEFERTEDRLIAWGYICWETAKVNGCPGGAGLHSMIAHMQRETRKHRKKRRKKGEDPPPVMACKQTRSFITPQYGIGGDVLAVDKAISRLPNWAQKCIFRTYMYGQPDRIASKEMKMRIGEYSQRRRAAVELVAIALGRSYIGTSLPRA